MVITTKNSNISSNTILHFDTTSVGLSESMNLYVLSKVPLTNLNVRFKNELGSSKAFSLYSIPKTEYVVTANGTTTADITSNVAGFPVTLLEDDTEGDLFAALIAAIDATNEFTTIQNGNQLTIIPQSSGSNHDGAVVVGDFNLNGIVGTVVRSSESNDTITKESVQTLTNTSRFFNTATYAYKLNVLFSPEIDQGEMIDDYEWSHWNDLLIDYVGSESESLEIRIIGTAEEASAKHIVALQNFKKFITDDYYTALLESKQNQNTNDEVLLNRKRKEYLLQYFEMSGFVSAYKSLLAAIEFFGWGELLEIREYWKSISDDQYKLTSIKNQVLDRIDKQLVGYRKTNQMALVYQINEQTGTDSDDLPIYTNVLDDTDAVLTKLYAMERVIECDFLTLNSHIVDIIGEFQSVVGVELVTWLNDAEIWSINLTENINSDIVFTQLPQVVEIRRHEVIIPAWAYEERADGENLDELTGITTAVVNSDFIDIEKIVDEETTTFDEFEWATKYYMDDFGLVRLDVTLDASLYQSYRYVVLEKESGVELFRTAQKPIVTLADGIKCGIKRLGEYKLILVLFDHYGGISVVGEDNNVKVINRNTDFYIAKHDIDGSLRRDLNLWTTFETNDAISRTPIVDPIHTSLDINTWDPITNNPLAPVLKYYEEDFDMLAVRTTISEMNSIPISRLPKVPIHRYGYLYGTMIIDLVGNGNAGNRRLGFKLFEGHKYDYIDTVYNTTTYARPELYLQHIISILNTKPEDSIYRRFTYDINWYSDNPEGHINDARPMLRVKSKEHSLMVNKFFWDIPLYHPNTDFPAMVKAEDLLTFTVVDSNAVLFHNGSTLISDFVVKVDDAELRIVDKRYNTITEIKDDIDAWIAAENMQNLSTFTNGDALVLQAKGDLTISHVSIGTYSDIYRGKDSAELHRIPIGTDTIITEPIYAFIDEDTKTRNADIIWELSDAVTGKVITTQRSYAFRYVPTVAGSYTLKLTTVDKYGTNVEIKEGCYLVV